MKRSFRLFAAVAGGALIAGVAAAPAQAAVNGDLAISPATGSFQFGTLNPAETLTITPPAAACPATGTGFYADFLVLSGAPAGATTTPTVITTPTGGLITKNGQATTFVIPPHDTKLTSNLVENLVDKSLPAGTTDTQLSTADAAKPVGTVIAEDSYDIVGLCLASGTFATTAEFRATITIKGATRAPKPSDWDSTHPGQPYMMVQYSWNTGASTGPEASTTTLTASPAGSATQGTAVSLSAGVSPSDAAGTVEFFDGNTSLGSKTVSGGNASMTTSGLGTGSHSLTAKFTPSDTGAFQASTSPVLSYSITASGGGGNGGGNSGAVTLQTTVSASSGGGSLTMTVDRTTTVALPAPTRSGDDLVTSTGNVDLVTVTDTRSNDKPGWGVTGRVSDTFTGTTSSNNTFAGTALGWTPKVASQTSGQGVVAGSAITPGSSTGLTGTGATLASAPGASGIGTAQLNADLGLSFPASTPADTYKADITLTAI